VTGVLRPRERRAFETFAENVLAPAPPLPPVAQTDATDAFDAWLARAPRVNRAAARVALRTFATRPGAVARLERGHGRAAVEALRAAAAVSYYGDPRVSALLGYDPPRP
jgi:hypothetical protein